MNGARRELEAGVLGVTGGIGAGKSSFCRILEREYQLPLIDADALGHEALLPGTRVYESLLARFGEEMLQPDGSFDRARLGRIVFADPKALADLNSLVHPWILERIELRVAALKASGYPGIILYDAALLLDWMDRYRPEAIVIVTASEAVRLERLERRGLARADAERRIRAQCDLFPADLPEAGSTGDLKEADADAASGISEADWIVNNDGTLDDLAERARSIYEELIGRSKRERSPS